MPSNTPIDEVSEVKSNESPDKEQRISTSETSTVSSCHELRPVKKPSYPQDYVMLTEQVVSVSYASAIECIESDFRKSAMEEEMASLKVGSDGITS